MTHHPTRNPSTRRRFIVYRLSHPFDNGNHPTILPEPVKLNPLLRQKWQMMRGYDRWGATLSSFSLRHADYPPPSRDKSVASADQLMSPQLPDIHLGIEK